jgi:CHAT domain-containing protein/tetratricopeptide (TPR) repeat protein
MRVTTSLPRAARALLAALLGTPLALGGQTPAAPTPDSAALLRARGDSASALQTDAGRHEAIEWWTRAAMRYAGDGRRVEAGQMLHNVGRAYRVLGPPDSALHYYRRALAARRDAGDERGAAATLGAIGNIHADLGQADSALRYYREALSVQRATGDRRAEGVTLNNVGTAHREVGRADSALHYYRRALAALRAAGDRRAAEAQTLTNIGAVYADLGRRDSALAHYIRALAIRRELGDRSAAGGTLGNIGATFTDLGRPDSAVTYYREALDAYRAAGDRQGEGGTLNNLGTTYRALARPDSAMAAYVRALVLARARGDRRTEATALDNIGAMHADAGRADSALAHYGQALAIRREVGDRRGEGGTLANLGRLYLEDPRPGHRDLARAVGYLDSAAATFAGVRGDAGADANAISLAEDNRALFTRWALAWLARADSLGADVSARAALAVAERGRARALLGLLRRRGGRGTDGSLSGGDTRPGADLAAEADSLLAGLRGQGVAALSYLMAADTLIVWLALPSGELHVARAPLPRDTLAALVVAARAWLEAGDRVPTASSVAVRGSTARALVVAEAPVGPRATHAAASDAGPRALARLAALLLPVELRERFPSAGEMVVVPHGALALVPFGALPLGVASEPLGARYALRLAPSLASLAAAEARPASLTRSARARGATPGGALVVGDPVTPLVPSGLEGGTARLERLPAAAREARSVARQLGVRALTGIDATESAVWARVGTAAIVHLATHGVAFNSDARVRDSFVALAADSASDGLLTVGELLDDGALTLVADLVVLSACQTGLGNVTEAEGMVGLVRAFLGRGARSVLVSLWNVSDEATALLMERFYAHWLRDADRPSKAEALGRAQRDVRRTPGFSHPTYWAAFQLVGAR